MLGHRPSLPTLIIALALGLGLISPSQAADKALTAAS
jgi:hypothetical protein